MNTRHDLAKLIKLPVTFLLENETGYVIEYKYGTADKVFFRSHLPMVELLESYGFIENYTFANGEFYVTEVEGDEVILLQDYMNDRFSQLQALTFLTEFHYRQETKQEVKAAYQISCDRYQFEEIIN